MEDSVTGLDRLHSAGGHLARAVAGGGALLFLALCAFAARGNVAGESAVVLAALASAGALTTRWTEGWTAVIGGLSLILTGLIFVTGARAGGPSVLVEIMMLLVLVARVVWRSPRRRLLPLTVLGAAAVIAVPLRAKLFAVVLFSAPLAVLVAAAVGAGLYLRAADARRARALAGARRDERLELARDLHDFVAHHVTGIVVQAQAAHFTLGTEAGRDPERLGRMLGGIETAGTEALTSMRRMVGLLREAQGEARTDGENGGDGGVGADGGADGGSVPGEAGRSPLAGMAQVEELVARFGGPPATLTLDPDLGAPAPEVATSVHRVVQESLTNVRKHAADATAVQVSVVRHAPGDGPVEVEVAVRDDGRGRGARLPAGGFGLAGLRERVEAIGGRLRAGPRPEGGWEVVAVIPDRRP
ncbi:sensor histidine kinase [Actinomadura viridis]|uniref:sensor histidine kinase n=1 Tax=Actinomadura viridis TaxID=58110 RepID=UPI003690E37D